MKKGFTFNKVSLMFLRNVIFKNFGGGGGETEKSQVLHPFKTGSGRSAWKMLHRDGLQRVGFTSLGKKQTRFGPNARYKRRCGF